MINGFTKEELQELLLACLPGINEDPIVREWKESLQDRIKDMIDNYQDEEEIHSCYIALSFDETFFQKKQAVYINDLLPVIKSLANQINGIVTEPGTYAFKLRLVKMK